MGLVRLVAAGNFAALLKELYFSSALGANTYEVRQLSAHSGSLVVCCTLIL